MTVNHLPHTPVELVTWQTFGFVSAAEAFVFLSGLVTGWVYGRIALRDGFSVMRRRVSSRLRVIYFAHAGFLTCVMFLACFGLADIGSGFHPGWSLWLKTLLFIAAPAYPEILRLYFVLFLFIPVILRALSRQRMRYVLAISVTLWLIAGFGYGMRSLPNSGYFDLLSWQLLFVVGVCLGYPKESKSTALESSTTLTVLAVVIVIAGFGFRHERLLTGHMEPYIKWLSDWRHTLPVLRLMNFAALAFLIYRFRDRLSPLVDSRFGRSFAFLGRHSLQTFVWSVAMTSVVAITNSRWASASPLIQTIMAIALVMTCFIPAWLHARWQQLRRTDFHPVKRSTLVPAEEA